MPYLLFWQFWLVGSLECLLEVWAETTGCMGRKVGEDLHDLLEMGGEAGEAVVDALLHRWSETGEFYLDKRWER